jgi:hypothetical protein
MSGDGKDKMIPPVWVKDFIVPRTGQINEDWVSGDTVWLLDVIAGDRKAATAVLANFRQLSGERAVKIHPIVARLVDAEILQKMKAQPVGGGGQSVGNASEG